MPSRKRNTISKLKKLGEGSFGCVISRPMECLGKETVISTKEHDDRKQVAKLFYDKKYFKNEVRLGKITKKIDPSEEKILVPVSGCAVSRKTIHAPMNIAAVSKCENMASTIGTKEKSAVEKSTTTLEKVWQLTMPYGGKDIGVVLKNYKNGITVHSVAKMMLPLFEALVLLKSRGMVHQDIKIENVLAYRKKAVLIDFSLSLPFSEIYTPNNYRRLKRRYRPFPPEYYMASIMIKYNDEFKGMNVNMIKQSISERYVNHLENIQHYFSPFYTVEELITSSNYGSLMSIAISNYKKFAEYADKIDTFSVGTLLTDLNEYIINAKSNPDYVVLMRGLLNPDPRRRLTPEEALALCKKISQE